MNYMDHSCLFSDHQKTLSHEIQKFVYIVPSYPLTFEKRSPPPQKKKKSLQSEEQNAPKQKEFKNFYWMLIIHLMRSISPVKRGYGKLFHMRT